MAEVKSTPIKIVVDPITGKEIKKGWKIISGQDNIRAHIQAEGRLAVIKMIAQAEVKDISNPAIINAIKLRIAQSIIPIRRTGRI